MKFVVFLLCGILCGAGLAAGPDALSGVERVYLMPMANGLDQYLASRLVAAGVFEVVTDPHMADAVLTDHLGEAFEAQLIRLAGAEASGGAGEQKASDSAAGSDLADKPPVRRSSFGRSRGTIFLVNVKSRAVIWSTYARPKNGSSKQLDRTAEKISGRLRRALKQK